MPGGRIVMYNPNRTTHKVSVRGMVVEHSEFTTGWWLWKKLWYGIKVRMFDDQHRQLREKLRHLVIFGYGYLPYIEKDVLTNFPTQEQRDAFPINSTVGCTFGYSGQLEQFFQGSNPFTLHSVVSNPESLEAELSPAQPCLF